MVKPLATPLPGLWNRGWLHPVGDALLCAARCTPAALIIMYDAQVREHFGDLIRAACCAPFAWYPTLDCCGRLQRSLLALLLPPSRP